MLTTSRRLARTIRSRAWSSPSAIRWASIFLLVGGQQSHLVDLPEIGLQGALNRVTAVSANTGHEDPRCVGRNRVRSRLNHFEKAKSRHEHAGALKPAEIRRVSSRHELAPLLPFSHSQPFPATSRPCPITSSIPMPRKPSPGPASARLLARRRRHFDPEKAQLPLPGDHPRFSISLLPLTVPHHEISDHLL